MSSDQPRGTGEAPPPGGSPQAHIETVAVHAGHAPDPGTGAVTPPIHLSTSYARGPDGALLGEFLYSRTDNPTRRALEECLAALEGGSACAAFSSGSAATMAILQALSPGDHVLAPLDAYYNTAEQLRTLFGPWGLESSFADFTDPEAVRAGLRPNTRLVWVETPSNPLLRVSDIGQIAQIAHEAGAHVAVDSTWATPVLQRPLDLGADLVMHATTKYLGGHGDVLGGAVVAREADPFFQRVRQIQTMAGAVPSPFECWLVLRGVRTLPHRMRVHSESAMRIAGFLDVHPAVEAVHYPGLASHPGHSVARRQMSAFGGMLSLQVAGGRDAALAVNGATRVFTRATSLGGPESLIEHRATVEGPASRTPANLLRLSVGLEHPDDLIADLGQALDAL
ncbi:MAG TPA: aminotransferase class V-fold PLP-dependent enzyme [Longimicrobiaceae bacterium]|nr:aminotransferase class V-fold PLP-dependent enzyme [Longimicrobiaceae bacterium]